MNLADKEKREEIEALVVESGIAGENSELIFSFTAKNEAYFKTDIIPDEESLHKLKRQVFEKTGIEIYIVKQ